MSSLRRVCEEQQAQVYYASSSYLQSAEISSLEQYRSIYESSISHPVEFWRNIAISEFHWREPPPESQFLNYNFQSGKGRIFVEWMRGGVTNMSYNCLDKNIVEGHGDKLAYIWEGNSPGEQRQITYRQLKVLVCKFANVLKKLGVRARSNVAIYMPVTIELTVAMLACARLGAVHTVVFGGFSAEALADRIKDANSTVLVTSDAVYRATKLIRLKDIADAAIDKSNGQVRACVVLARVGLARREATPHTNTYTKSSSMNQGINMDQGINNNNNNNNNNNDHTMAWNANVDLDWHQAMVAASDECECTWVDATHPLFVLYSSGSTGKPKGIVQATGGYMVYSATMFRYVFNYHTNDIMFCTADLGWITGHTMSVYGALCNRATCVLFEGTPFYPDAGRIWSMVDRHQVTILHSAPTVVRSLMRHDNTHVTRYTRASLKLLGLVGEPVNPDAWRWFYEVAGASRCPIVDTYFQTETAAPIITPLPGATPLKPGSATLPFFGVAPLIVDDDGHELLEPDQPGHLVFDRPWPGMLATLNGDHQRFESTYFSRFSTNALYATGDRAKRDADGYYWILGRSDDMLNISGHLLSTAEVEGALATHAAVAEAAVVSYPHEIKGEALSCYIVMKNNIVYDDKIESDIKSLIRSKIGPVAIPDRIQCMKELPKTRSGKIMRRILKRATCGDSDLGDISTMADPSALKELFPVHTFKTITAN